MIIIFIYSKDSQLKCCIHASIDKISTLNETANTLLEAEPLDSQCFTRYSSGDGQGVLRSDQSLEKVAS